jgi:carboxypeptidase Q
MKTTRALLVALSTCLLSTTAAAQIQVDAHRAAADRLIDAALRDSAAHRRLSLLADKFGSRFSGAPSLERAIDWIVEEMKKDGLENVHTEPVMVTHWVRGEESAEIVSPRPFKLNILGLGRSVGTAAAGITAPVLVVRDFAELRRRAAEAKGRIVVFNYAFDTTITPFAGYGDAVRYRSRGADSARAVGAVAALVRSITPRSLNTPHTGGMSYGDTSRAADNIPTAAITVENAELLQRMQDRGERVVVRLRMGARTLPPAPSRNIVAEIRGSERPNEVIVMGGHIDSWDVGQGAMDDGAGCVSAWEALRLIKELGVRPKRTIRVVFWTNEEIGLAGGNGYRDAHRAELADHIYALESDNGVFTPRGIFFTGSQAGLDWMRSVTPLLKRVGADAVSANGAEADVGPISALGVPALSIDTDQSRYFWYHHTEADTPEKIDPADMQKVVAIMAVLANTVGNTAERIPR